MAKPYIHAKSSAKKFGGNAEDYIDIHDFMDSSKSAMSDNRHRAVFHSSFGCFVVEKMFGTVRKNSDNKDYSPRDVAEQHIVEDLGFIPTLSDYLGEMEIKPWMCGIRQDKADSQKKVEGVGFKKENSLNNQDFNKYDNLKFKKNNPYIPLPDISLPEQPDFYKGYTRD